MEVHIALVGGQPVPVYYGIIATHPEKIIYICSNETREIAERIQNVIHCPSELSILSATDIFDIKTKVEMCKEQFGNDNITINISGGTKLWAFYFTIIIGALANATVIYIDQNNVLWNLKNSTKSDIKFNIDNTFKLNGNPLIKYSKLENYNTEDDNVLKKIEDLRLYLPGTFNFLTDELEKKSNLTEVKDQKSGSSLKWMGSEKEFCMCLVKKNGKKLNLILRSPNVRKLLLNSGWFEYKIAKILSKWNRCIEIRLNCIFPAKDNSSPKNECDIVVNTGSKVLFVECKTKLKKPTDIDKFHSVVKNYGGMSSKALFITEEPLSSTAVEKCNEYGILSFSLKSYNLNIDVETALFTSLNSELFNINSK